MQLSKPIVPKEFKTPTTRDAFKRGYDRGFNIASWQNLPEVGETFWIDGEGKVTVAEGEEWDVVGMLAYDAESNDRCYSPFEFTASEFNKARNSEARWDAFQTGIDMGISANIAQRQKAFAGKVSE